MTVRTMRHVVETQAHAWDAMVDALEHGQIEHAAHLAEVVSAAALIRIAGTPEPRRGQPDPFDHDDPHESETERYWSEKTDRRLERD